MATLSTITRMGARSECLPLLVPPPPLVWHLVFLTRSPPPSPAPASCNKSPITTRLYANLQGVVAAAAGVPGAEGVLLTLEETACSSGGGCENVTDRFIAGWAWMTTLNTVAEAGFHRVHRQDIAGWSFAFGMSHYMLLGPAGWTNGSHATLTPHPDYYLTVLFRQLVGSVLLPSSLSPDAPDTLDLHAWCSGPRSPAGAGGVVVTYVNYNAKDAAVSLPPALASAPATLYSLTATPSGTPEEYLASDVVYLNGVALTVDAAGNLPAYPIPGKAFTGGATLSIPGYSYGFVVFGGSFGVCTGKN